MALPHLEFVIADSAHCRWVRKGAGRVGFTTYRRVDGPPALNGDPPGGMFEGWLGRRAGPLIRGRLDGHSRSAFAQHISDELGNRSRREPTWRVALVAPARMLAVIEDRLDDSARSAVVARLRKDLVKTPDYGLGRWLDALERRANQLGQTRG